MLKYLSFVWKPALLVTLICLLALCAPKAKASAYTAVDLPDLHFSYDVSQAVSDTKGGTSTNTVYASAYLLSSDVLVKHVSAELYPVYEPDPTNPKGNWVPSKNRAMASFTFWGINQKLTELSPMTGQELHFVRQGVAIHQYAHMDVEDFSSGKGEAPLDGEPADVQPVSLWSYNDATMNLTGYVLDGVAQASYNETLNGQGDTEVFGNVGVPVRLMDGVSFELSSPMAVTAVPAPEPSAMMVLAGAPLLFLFRRRVPVRVRA